VVTDKHRRLGLRLLQVVVTIGLMVWLLKTTEWSSMLPLVAELRWGFLVLSVIFLLLSHLINVVRWQYLLQHYGTTYGRLLGLYGAGLFSNSFLPTGFGGDSVRVVLLSQDTPVRHSLFSVGLDRVMGFIALSALLGVGLWAGPPPGLSLRIDGLISAFSGWNSLLTGMLLIAAVGLLGLTTWHRLSSLRARLMGAFTRFVQTVNWSQWTIGRWSRLFTGGYVFSVLAHMCMVAATWVLLRAVGIEVTPAASVWLVLVSALSLLFPIAINGLGVQEAVFVTILSAYDIPSTPALLAALLGRVVQVLFVLAGGAAWLLSSRTVKTENVSSSV
jgi:uncharacterized protein (TIRG00374 family)